MVNYFWIEIKGKNIKRFISQIVKQKINIHDLKYKEKSVLLKVSYDDYKKIKSIKTTYEINIVKIAGKKKIIDIFKKYQTSLLIFIISIFFVILLSNIVFSVTIETNNKGLKEIINKDLKKENITIYSLKKSYNKLNEISNNIKNNNLDKIEWIEISQKGVKTNVKIIERITESEKESRKYKDIVAEKNGYIRQIYSRKGQLLKNIDDYVKKGEVIISGNIFRNEKVVSKVKASGKVYAEVWYIVKANKPVYYTKDIVEKKGNVKLTLNINNHEINFIKIPKNIDIQKKKTLYETKNLCLYINKEKNHVLEKAKYTEKEISNILNIKAKNKVLKTLEKDEYIIKQKTLKKYYKNDKMYVEVFFKTYENIAAEKDIAKIEEKKDEKEE